MLKSIFRLFIIWLTSWLCRCDAPTSNQQMADFKLTEFDIQGHRGCRGLMPENSIPGFIRAVELGVTTLELDVVITQDSQVVVSHEPWFSPEICLDSTGQEIPEDAHDTYNIYKMTYDQVKAFDCGSKPVKNFPEQTQLSVTKPLLSAVIDTVEAYIIQHNLEPVYYNIEIKSNPQRDTLFHPVPVQFAALLLEIIQEKGIATLTTIQSFDPRALRAVHAQQPDLSTALLVESQADPHQMITDLGYKPSIYSPYYKWVNEAMVSYCKDSMLQLIPWTVNDTSVMQHLIESGVTGIITDYPDRLIHVVERLSKDDIGISGLQNKRLQ